MTTNQFKSAAEVVKAIGEVVEDVHEQIAQIARRIPDIYQLAFDYEELSAAEVENEKLKILLHEALKTCVGDCKCGSKLADAIREVIGVKP